MDVAPQRNHSSRLHRARPATFHFAQPGHMVDAPASG